MSEESESFKLSSGSETPTNPSSEGGGGKGGGGGSGSSTGGTPTTTVTGGGSSVGSGGSGSVGIPDMGGGGGGGGPTVAWTSAPHVDDYYYYNSAAINFQQNGYYFQNFGQMPNMGESISFLFFSQSWFKWNWIPFHKYASDGWESGFLVRAKEADLSEKVLNGILTNYSFPTES